ncbi:MULTISPECIES: hypothetical protein [Sphingobium]|uniref:hypothetical protein n=1 Tax=Sphingobium sp. MI1205 TaxID=407020 RepID=UPI000A4634F5|nr:hypothetical protein [Sphingobium sp. MI1205]
MPASTAMQLSAMARRYPRMKSDAARYFRVMKRNGFCDFDPYGNGRAEGDAAE